MKMYVHQYPFWTTSSTHNSMLLITSNHILHLTALWIFVLHDCSLHSHRIWHNWHHRSAFTLVKINNTWGHHRSWLIFWRQFIAHDSDLVWSQWQWIAAFSHRSRIFFAACGTDRKTMQRSHQRVIQRIYSLKRLNFGGFGSYCTHRPVVFSICVKERNNIDIAEHITLVRRCAHGWW